MNETLTLNAGLAAVLVGTALCALAQSQPATAASLSGTITNAATGRTLEGARVAIKGTHRETIADREAVYRFDDLAPGAAVLFDSYSGLTTVEVPVEISSVGRKRRDVELTAAIYTLDGRYPRWNDIAGTGHRWLQTVPGAQTRAAHAVSSAPVDPALQGRRFQAAPVR